MWHLVFYSGNTPTPCFMSYLLNQCSPFKGLDKNVLCKMASNFWHGWAVIHFLFSFVAYVFFASVDPCSTQSSAPLAFFLDFPCSPWSSMLLFSTFSCYDYLYSPMCPLPPWLFSIFLYVPCLYLIHFHIHLLRIAYGTATFLKGSLVSPFLRTVRDGGRLCHGLF